VGDWYWAGVRFNAEDDELILMTQATGWHARYLMGTGEELHLYARMPDPSSFLVQIAPRASRELEVLIYAGAVTKLHKDARWRIQHGEHVHGSCELLELFGSWQNDVYKPKEIEDRGGRFCAI
jgi:hypothetical protein